MYGRGCDALGRDCAEVCPYAAHAPCTVEGAAVWSAGTACVTATSVGVHLNLAGALAVARELGAAGWAAADLLAALHLGLAEGVAARASPTPDAGGVAHGG